MDLEIKITIMIMIKIGKGSGPHPFWSRDIVTTIVKIEDFGCLTRNKTGTGRHRSRNIFRGNDQTI
jgi:hypothetical protein